MNQEEIKTTVLQALGSIAYVYLTRMGPAVVSLSLRFSFRI